MSLDDDRTPRRGVAPMLLIVAGVLSILGALALVIVLVLPAVTGRPTTATATAIATPALTAPPSAREQGARFVAEGECVAIEGTAQEPLLNIISCGPGGYQVLRRFDGTIDADNRCKPVVGYEYNFSYDSALDSLDFVLCLKQLR
ncbi:hypothetical protein F4553_004339 [Allocatelliglobosispora scoriae]|uniref:Uncharacterized protein n=1 Tax=Allocatelliglobosispora scoriae TaxID=643052 RepID=A0A841BW34_9ACTN|nr:hypothetical protein [Allocatelliglobosispora scoriae]MBB5870960.1 hypothetical protein [Allocatelliglobosispora scoriae]